MGKTDHIIVLMMENRSFDHMLGFLQHPNAKFDGLKGTESCPDQLGTPVTVSQDALYEVASPDHSHAGIMQQLLQTNTKPPYKPTNKGFVQNYEERSPGNGRRIMSCFDRRMIPVFTKLAEEFCICTRWFCSVPGETWPNREFVHSATSRGRADIVSVRYHSNAKTIYELLDAENKSWRIYHDDTPHSWCYPALWDIPFKRNRFKPIRDLYEDIRGDRLANYTFVEPDYGLALIGSGWGNSMHPSQAPTADEFLGGERLISRIYEELKANPKVFEKTLFIITFDEHGGFYDHVPPQATVNPVPGQKWKGQFDFDLLGVRVPTLIISPWIKKHTIDETNYDHTSIIQTVRTKFAAKQKPLTKRDAQANPILLNQILTNTLRGPNELPLTLPLSTADGEALQEKIVGGAPRSRAVSSTVEVSDLDPFKSAMLALSASVGARLALERGHGPSTRGMAAIAPSWTPAAVVEAFRASASSDPPPAPPKKPKAKPAPKGKKPGAKTRGLAAAKAGPPANPRRDEIAQLVLALLGQLTGITAINEASALERDLGLDADERRELAAPLTGIVSRYAAAHVSRDECAALKTVGAAIDLVLQKVS